MIYRLLRWVSGIALHWFYRDIHITNGQLIPDRGPLFIAVNHQNALVDSLIAGWILRRRLTMTAKATLIENPAISLLFTMLGVVPLRRVSDEVTRPDLPIDPSRNSGAFEEILDVLERNGAVLIFPEGKSHNRSQLEPLKKGLARLALTARDIRGIRQLKILPVGLVFEDKARPGSAVAVNVGEAICVDSWIGADAAALTEEIARRLRRVSESPRLLPAAEARAVVHTSRSPKSLLMQVAAVWGRLTHKLPITLARNLAVRSSSDADQPAMRTIVLATGMVLLTYAASFAIVDAFVHSLWMSAMYVVSLGVGAYSAAFEGHRTPD